MGQTAGAATGRCAAHYGPVGDNSPAYHQPGQPGSPVPSTRLRPAPACRAGRPSAQAKQPTRESLEQPTATAMLRRSDRDAKSGDEHDPTGEPWATAQPGEGAEHTTPREHNRPPRPVVQETRRAGCTPRTPHCSCLTVARSGRVYGGATGTDNAVHPKCALTRPYR